MSGQKDKKQVPRANCYAIQSPPDLGLLLSRKQTMVMKQSSPNIYIRRRLKIHVIGTNLIGMIDTPPHPSGNRAKRGQLEPYRPRAKRALDCFDLVVRGLASQNGSPNFLLTSK